MRDDRHLFSGYCPACGEGKLYRNWCLLLPSCDHCGLDFSRHDSADGPAYFVILALGLGLTPIIALIEVYYQPPYWLQALIWLPVTVILGIALLRPFKSMMLRLNYKHRNRDFSGGN